MGSLCGAAHGIAGSLCEAVKGGKTFSLRVAAVEEVRSCCINQKWGGGGNEGLKIGSEGYGNGNKQGEDGSV